LYKLFGIISLFPLWAFRFNLIFFDYVLILTLFFFIPFLIHNKISELFSKNHSLPFLIWISFLFVYSIDQNLGLWSFSTNLFKIHSSIYFESLLFIFLFFLATLIFILVLKKNGIKIFFSIILSIFLFNTIDTSKNLTSFPKVEKNNFSDYLNQGPNNKKLILILDEMSGINGSDSNHSSGKKAKQALLELFKENNFDVYTNIYSIFTNTARSIPSILNFFTNTEKYETTQNGRRYLFIEKSKNYFQQFNLIQNSFFDSKSVKNIIVYQSMYINYCNHKKVFKCYQFNPFNYKKEYLIGFKNNSLTRIFSAYKNNASASSNILWKLLRLNKIIDSSLEPEGQKASFKYRLDNILNSLENENADLLFAHILVPHTPYGFNKKCQYDGSLANYFTRMSSDQKKNQHNQERVCVAFFLKKFFELLKEKKMFYDLEILIFSDTHSKINNNIFDNSVLFAIKKSKSNSYKIISKKTTSNEIFKKYYYNIN
jgi:hypothetical protein